MEPSLTKQAIQDRQQSLGRFYLASDIIGVAAVTLASAMFAGLVVLPAAGWAGVDPFRIYPSAFGVTLLIASRLIDKEAARARKAVAWLGGVVSLAGIGALVLA